MKSPGGIRICWLLTLLTTQSTITTAQDKINFGVPAVGTYTSDYNFTKNDCPLLTGGKYSGELVDGGEKVGRRGASLRSNTCDDLRCDIDGGLYVEEITSSGCEGCEGLPDEITTKGLLKQCAFVKASGKYFFWKV